MKTESTPDDKIHTAKSNYDLPNVRKFHISIASTIAGVVITGAGMFVSPKIIDSTYDYKLFEKYEQSKDQLRILKHIKNSMEQYYEVEGLEYDKIVEAYSSDSRQRLYDKINSLESEVEKLSKSNEVKLNDTKEHALSGILAASIMIGAYFMTKYHTKALNDVVSANYKDNNTM